MSWGDNLSEVRSGGLKGTNYQGPNATRMSIVVRDYVCVYVLVCVHTHMCVRHLFVYARAHS